MKNERKEELKDEMKNRISLALKDPILQQGFEIICKENTELKTKKIPLLERKVASIRGCHRVDLAKLNARIEQVERLKKENAELKEEMNAKQVVLNDFKSRVETVTDRFNKKSSQLTKAKEFLGQWLQSSKASGCDNINIVTDTEQFLSEVEK